MPITVEQFEEYRDLLFGIAYRMLGSASDAEDVVQDAYLRACGAADEPVRVPRAFLATIVTRLCLDRLKAVRATREQYFGPWLPEPILHDGPAQQAEQTEMIAMAMLVLLERLSPLERAVFVLREAFEFPYEEIGPMIGRTAAACRQAHHRAHKHVAAQQPRYQPSAEQQHQLVAQFLGATRDGDLATLTTLLASDVMYIADGGGVKSAASKPVYGAPHVALLMVGIGKVATRPNPPPFAVAPAWINGEMGLLLWVDGMLDTAFVFTCTPTAITTIHVVRNPTKLAFLNQQIQRRYHS